MHTGRFSSVGYSLIELVLVIVLIAILATYTVSSLNNNSESIRYEATRGKMDAIRSAIIGSDTTNAEGRRLNFGYHADMGKLPTTLTDLTTIGTQPAWVYSTNDGFGYGWRGPYLGTAATGQKPITKDEWGQSFVYSTGGNPPSLTSYGADGAAGGSGYYTDLVVEFLTSVRLATVKGVVVDKDTRQPSATVQIRYPANGALSSATTTSDANGMFSFSAIPFGVRSLLVTSTPTLGPKTVVVDKSNTDISSSVLDYYGATEALTLVASSANLSGGSANTTGYNNQTAMAQVASTYRTDLQIAFITVTVGNGAQLLSYAVNGVKNIFASPVTSGTRTAVNIRQVIPARSLINNLELNFDTNVKNTSVSVLFEYYNSSRTDTITLTGNPSWGLAGTLDLSLNTTGSVTTSIGTGNEEAYAVVVQTDARLVAVGRSHNGINEDLAIIRYKIDGSLDTSFKSTGKVVTTIGTSNDYLFAAVIQTDGKTSAAGSTQNTNLDVLVVRYQSNGLLDTSFNTIGSAQATLSSGNDELYGLALQTDGSLVATGIATLAVVNVVLVRYMSNGILDTSFNTTGKVFTSMGTDSSYGRAIILQSDGKLVVSGYTNSAASGNYDYLMMRYNTNGTLDTSFKTSGKVVTTVGASHDYGRAIALQTDGKLLQVGFANASEDFATLRFNTDGTLDTSFNSSGKLFTSVGTANDEAHGVQVQQNGKIVLGGTADLNGAGAWNFALVRYNTNGTLDTSFNTTGKLTLSINTADILYGIAIDTNGKIVGAGRDTNGTNQNFGIIRVWP